MKARYKRIKPTYIKINPEDTNLGDLVINQISRALSKYERNNICFWKRKKKKKKQNNATASAPTSNTGGEKGDDLPF
jgi:hypothetical protein